MEQSNAKKVIYNQTLDNGVDFTAKISDWKAISEDENEIAQTLISNGPLSVALNALQL